MNSKKIVGGIFSDVSDEVTQNCSTCKWASPFTNIDYVICSKKRIIKADNICKKYEYNRLLKQPKKKHNLIEKHFIADDFSID